jgi:hypothetical protein
MMSFATSAQSGVTAEAATPRGQVIGTYATYAEAQHAVDYLADSAFPVANASIIGRDLTLVERVTGRMTKTRAALMGAGAGAWFGLFVGLFVGLFANGPVWFSLVVAGVVIGAGWGATFGFVGQWATRGERDFTSNRGLVAARYELTVANAYAEQARTLISQLG